MKIAAILAGVAVVVAAPAAAATPDPLAIAAEHLAAGRTEAAILTLRRAIVAAPANAALEAKLGYVYRYAGLTERSIAAYRRAEALDASPASRITDEGQIAKAQIHAGDFAGAAATRAGLARLLADSGRSADEKMHFYDGVVALFAGRKTDAIRSFDASEALGVDSVWKDFAVAYRALAKGDNAAALAAARGFERRADAADGERHFRVADLYAGAGDVKGALRAIGVAIDAGFYNLSAINGDPLLAPVRADPGFGALRARATARRADAERAAVAPLVPLRFTLAIHGGGGVRPRDQMTLAIEAAYRADLARALEAGRAMLAAGGTSVDAVEAAVNVMEDSPLFNAGKGASFNREGVQEFDAAIMDGATHDAGSVGVVQRVRNPISLARLVMEKSPHVMLAGEGALQFARAQGAKIEPPHYFFTERKWQSIEQRLRQNTPYGKTNEADSVPDRETVRTSAQTPDAWRAMGTVGAVALDGWGNLAAATSTGGREGKLAGRVGDSPIIGAGTYADNATLAVSSTGLGENVMRLVTTKNMADRMAYSGWSLARATRDGVDAVTAAGGTIGVVAVDRQGEVAMPFGGGGMYRGVVRETGAPVISIYDK